VSASAFTVARTERRGAPQRAPQSDIGLRGTADARSQPTADGGCGKLLDFCPHPRWPRRLRRHSSSCYWWREPAAASEIIGRGVEGVEEIGGDPGAAAKPGKP
jgi:hypothetical protein